MFRVVYIVLTVFAVISNADESGTLLLPEGRIVGGSDASIYDFPHQVSIQLYGEGHWYGGSIYSENIIITLASWIYYLDVANISIVAGTTLLSEPNVRVGVKEIITHPKYDFKNYDYNVALLVLSSPLSFGPGIQPIPLAKQRPPAGTVLTATGWGNTHQFDGRPDQLQKVNVNLMKQLDCRKIHIVFMTGRMLCTSTPDGGKDPCYGDEGGPLIFNNELLGVVLPHVFHCGNVKDPKVYTSIPDVYKWIEEAAQHYTDTFASA